jgi:YegS/Rv2252/BmrU family lipid kinase
MKGARVDRSPIVVVLNPVAGSGKSLAVLPRVKEAIAALDVPYHIYLTKSQGDGRAAACRLAKAGASVVIAVGGDGTVHEVANGLFDSGTQVPLGIVPAGSGADFARTLGLTKRIEETVPKACSGVNRAIDLGISTFSDGRSLVFINVAGLGYDALVARRVGKTKFLPGANLPYLAAALPTMATFKNFDATLDIDGERLATKSVFIQIANAMYMGGGYKIAPGADISDGLLDVAIVGDMSKPDLLRTIPKVYGGNHVNHPKFTLVRAREIRVETEQPVFVQLDGEVVGQTPVTFTIRPGAIMLAG